MSDLCFASARELATLIRRRKLSAREVMAEHLAQIERLNPKLNAIVAKLDDDECLELADAADRRLAQKDDVGPLHGLPTAFKDLESAVGFPFTLGSPIFKNFFPTEDTVIVERLRNAGVVPIGKTNVPEFGMGSHTYNKVYGTTVNPYDLTKSAGGSSGGAAAALAAGLLPVADGSDFGGSLRNPANFNNVVALRPTMGLVPLAPFPLPFVGFLAKGPMARSVADTALLLSVMAGADPRDPSCSPSDPSVFAEPLERDLRGIRVAWCPDLGGLPLDRRVRSVLDAQRRTFESLGCIVEEACPDLARGRQSVSRDTFVDVFSSPRTLAGKLPRPDQAGGSVGDRVRREAERCRRCRRRISARRDLRGNATLPGEVRFPAVCRESGAAVRRQPRLAKRDRGCAHGELSRVDEVSVLDLRDVLSRHIRACRLHSGRFARRSSDRGTTLGRSRRVADRPRLRASNRLRTHAARK
jgi:Asp-tRNA(Asn)/Glu-tRNA(Gln) amidotransferase A subunit family amidase